MESRKLIKNLILFSIFFIGCILIGIVIGTMTRETNVIATHFLPDEISVINVIFSFILMVISVLVLHEFGHLIAGLVQGFRFSLFIVGPLGVKRDENGKIKLFLNKDLSLYGGLAATEPSGNLEQVKQKFALVIMAGPLASLLFAFVFFGISWKTNTVFDFYAFISGFGHLAVFVATTIPKKSGLFFTDRKRFQRLVSGGPEADAELGILHATLVEVKHKSLKNADEGLIRNILKDKNMFCQFIGHYFMWKYSKDNNLNEQEKDWFQKLEGYKKSVPSSLWKMLQIAE